MEIRKRDLADEIHAARHSGEAKRLSKTIAPDDVRWEWEESHVDLSNGQSSGHVCWRTVVKCLPKLLPVSCGQQACRHS